MKHILVIDDDLEIRILLRKFLEMHNFLVSEAVNGKRALELCKSTRFDLIIVDIFMPEKDGISFIKDMQEISTDDKIKIIAISGGDPGHFFTSNLRLDVAKTIGAFHTLQKPFKMEELLQTIEKIFAHEKRLQTDSNTSGQWEELYRVITQESSTSSNKPVDVKACFTVKQDQLFKITQAIAALTEKADGKEVSIRLHAHSGNGFDTSWLKDEFLRVLTDAHVKIIAPKGERAGWYTQEVHNL